MPAIDRRARRIRVKVVYYGPGLSGKTTNLVQLHRHYPSDSRGALVKLDTESERTLFFDYFPANLGKVGGLQLQVDFFTVPGQSFYNATRRAVLRNVDGLVFVADSSPSREVANEQCLENLMENMSALGRSLNDLPRVYQWNKRDVDGAIPVDLLQRTINPHGRPAFEAVARDGVGVWETQRAILGAVVRNLKEQVGGRRAAAQ